jgi:hypothetical protein
MSRGVARYRALAANARNAALEGVAAYNHPLASFKSGTYVVLMHIAWTALFQAIFWKRRVKPYYRRPYSNRYERVDGRRKTWDLSECVTQYWGSQDNAVAQNLRFFIGLRNVIEHADAPDVDFDIFGECQAKLVNFDELVAIEFGERNCLNSSLAFSLQFARIRKPESGRAMAKILKSDASKDIRAFIDRFRSTLSPEIRDDMAYSFKVFLMPILGNHRTQETLAVEFVHYHPAKADEYDRAVSMIKQRLVPVVNLGVLRASDVVAETARKIAPKKFNISTHTQCWRYWGVRPPTNSLTPASCKTDYCQYDVAHHDYLYTEKWVELLSSELTRNNVYDEVIRFRPPKSAQASQAKLAQPA